MIGRTGGPRSALLAATPIQITEKRTMKDLHQGVISSLQ